ncbi:box C/D snoRNA protein 1-like isoform X2 [Apostichopus japonicus]|uniref:box C/D snoRNA protein 1-like isoform X2 n=1 Tax=Stichopus japonicus TaxID=307972 RepID=UPI003AB230B3
MLDSAKMDSRKGKCSTCAKNDALYTCPACHINSCSLLCVNQHKEKSGCSGVRDKTAFVPIQQFNETNLLSDYRFLEEVDRKSQAAQRARNQDAFQRSMGIRRHVQVMATRGGLDYEFLPPGFTNSKRNRTKVNQRISEDQTLQDILGVYLDPSVCDPIKRQQVKLYTQAGGLENVKVLIKSKPYQDKEKRGFHLLDKSKTLKDNFVGKSVVEYPTLLVALDDKLDEFKIVEPEPVVKQTDSTRHSEDNRNPNKRKRNRRYNRGRQNRRKPKMQKTGANGGGVGQETDKPDGQSEKRK